MSNHKLSFKLFAITVCSFLSATGKAAQTPSQSTDNIFSLKDLAENFSEPPLSCGPCVFWHWMGCYYSKEGIAKDLEAMKASGISGASIFNVSMIEAAHGKATGEGLWYGFDSWGDRTYRSSFYWDALRFTMSEAKRLGLKIGIHNSPGYSVTGGPWISEEQGMQAIVSTKKEINGNQLVNIALDKPELPVWDGWGMRTRPATFYRDIAVMAVPAGAETGITGVLDISGKMDADGNLKWQAPAGKWTVFRIGHAPTLTPPHPLPDELFGKALEVDKMSREKNIYHWEQVLNPMKEHLGEYIGDSFTYITIDSYESGGQNWTDGFREAFIRLKGYDPLPWIALQLSAGDGREDIKTFSEDRKDVISRLFIDNGWTVARDMVHQAGLQLYWEPYPGPFDTKEAVSLPDVPMGEFWTNGSEAIDDVVGAAKQYGKRIVAAEAFTGRPPQSNYTEDPAFLKHSADDSFVSGVNLMFLHHWTHQPFDDKYQPGLGLGWWGTHFGRHQTWFKPGKAFITYLSRCQMLLQQGDLVSLGKNILHRQTPEAEFFFVINPEAAAVEKTVAFPVRGRTPELWDAYRGTIRQTSRWREQGDSILVDLKLQPDESVFVVFPFRQDDYARLPETETLSETSREITGAWNVAFQPKLDKSFRRKNFPLGDWSKQAEPALKYFSGTAVYEKNISINAGDIANDRLILLDLGELHDIAELEVNGQATGVLWNPPYIADITPFVKKGNNVVKIAVTNNWANRLIGDEQEPADFEFTDEQAERRIIKAFPDWFIYNRPRPAKGRKTFNICYYYHRDSLLQPAGLLGPVQLKVQKVNVILK
ncbi:MAG: hypothetical protein LBR34_09420 [Prevotella sp.]|jgi:hypothetical protein|nr:hypothetical protein [Prevotella sp.]